MSQVCRRIHGGHLSPVSSLHIQPSRPDSAKPLPSPLPFLPSPHSPRSCILLTLFSDEAPMSFLQVFFQHLTQPKRSLRLVPSSWKELAALGTTSFLSLAVCFPPSWLLLWGKCFPSPLTLGPYLLGPTCTL